MKPDVVKAYAGPVEDHPIYMGYEIALGIPHYLLRSDLYQIDGMGIGSFGISAGGVLANPYAKVRATAGLFYSNANLPYSFDLLTGSLLTNLYLLRPAHARYRTFEPYLLSGIACQQISFYGNYLDNGTAKNYSTSQEPFLGKNLNTQLLTGLGVEYQFENNDHRFIHLFLEAAYGFALSTHSTRDVFDQTRITQPYTIRLGISFGKIKTTRS